MGAQSTITILRRRQVEEITGFARSTIYLLMKQGKFPRQRKLGTRAVGWRSDEIFQWVAEREIAA